MRTLTLRTVVLVPGSKGSTACSVRKPIYAGVRRAIGRKPRRHVLVGFPHRGPRAALLTACRRLPVATSSKTKKWHVDMTARESSVVQVKKKGIL